MNSGGGGGIGDPEEQTLVERALTELLEALPPDIAAKVTAGWRGTCRARVACLLAAGWRPSDLVRETASGHWRGVGSAGAVLAKRLEELAERPAPTPYGAVRTSPTLPPPCGHCDPNRMVETDRGMAYCPTCHPRQLAGAGVGAVQ